LGKTLSNVTTPSEPVAYQRPTNRDGSIRPTNVAAATSTPRAVTAPIIRRDRFRDRQDRAGAGFALHGGSLLCLSMRWMSTKSTRARDGLTGPAYSCGGIRLPTKEPPGSLRGPRVIGFVRGLVAMGRRTAT